MYKYKTLRLQYKTRISFARTKSDVTTQGTDGHVDAIELFSAEKNAAINSRKINFYKIRIYTSTYKTLHNEIIIIV